MFPALARRGAPRWWQNQVNNNGEAQNLPNKTKTIMEKYLNSQGRPIAYNGREIKYGDTIKAHTCGLELTLSVSLSDDALIAKNDTIEAYVETICKGSDKVEIINR